MPEMNAEELTAALVAAHTALVEKLGKQPYIDFDLRLSQSGKWKVDGCYLESNMRDRLGGQNSDSPDGAIASVMEAIRKLPSPDERNLRSFQKKVAEAIDFGNEHGIYGQWLNPLVETGRKLAENALTYEAAQ